MTCSCDGAHFTITFSLDLQTLRRILQENYKELTKWEVYQAELETGELQWGILHTEQFFKENARRMELDNFKYVRRLVEIIRGTKGDSNDYYYHEDPNPQLNDDNQEAMAIACFDLGEFVRYYPNGKAIAKRLGAKTIIMKLLMQPAYQQNAELQRHALQCMSKMLVSNWQVGQ